MNRLIFPHKEIRSKVILDYYGDADYICFSSGNAVTELRKLGARVYGCGNYIGADFKPLKWYSQLDIRYAFPYRVDVTCGHLSIELMNKLAQAYREFLGDLAVGCYEVPTGSGETLVCLKMAYPSIEFIAVYNIDNHTQYSDCAPLNKLVELLANDVYK